MPFLGKTPTVGNFILLDSITVSNTATFALTKDSLDYYPGSAQNMIVSVNGVTQAPLTAYTITDSNIIFASALDSDVDVIDYILVLGDTLNIGRPSDSTVGATQLQDYAVTSVKMSNTGVGAATYGTSTSIPQITIDAAGRITSAIGIDRSNTFEDLTVTGNLTVSGNTVTVDAQTLSVEDPLIHLASNNETSDVVDIGFVGHYSNDGGTTKLHTGFFRDASDEKYYLFNGFEDNALDLSSPTTTIDRTANTFALAHLNVGGLNANGIFTIGDRGTATEELTIFHEDNVSYFISDSSAGGGAKGEFSFRTNDGGTAAERVRIDGDGNVGIGTASPGEKLDVNGTIQVISSGNQGLAAQIYTDSAGNMNLLADHGDNGGGDHIFRNGSAATELVRILNTGKVGIGTPTPDSMLHVSGASNSRIIIEHSSAPRQNYIGIDSSDNLVLAADEDNLGADSSIRFRVDAAELMRIDSSGSVGVGTDGPNTNAKFEVVSTSAGAVTNVIQLRNGDATAGSGAKLQFLNSTVNYATAGTSEITGIRYSGNYSALTFTTYGPSSLQERMRIDGDGNVGIGTNNPSNRFTVNANTSTTPTVYINNGSPNATEGLALKVQASGRGTNVRDISIFSVYNSTDELFAVRNDGLVTIDGSNGYGGIYLKGEGNAITFDTSSTPAPTIKTGDTVSTNALEIDSDNGIILSFEGNDNDSGAVRVYNKATDVATPYPFSVFANNMVQFNVSGPALPDTGTQVLVRCIDDRGHQEALTLRADYDRDIGIKWLNDVSNENWKLFIDGAQDDSLILTDTADDYVFTIAQDSGHIALNPDNNTVIAKHRLEVKNGGISADYYVETSPNDEPNSLQASGALGKWVCMQSGTVDISTLEPYTDVYVRNSGTTVTEYTSSTTSFATSFSMAAGDLFWGSGPLGVVASGQNSRVAPFSAAGQYFGFTITRYDPTTIYVYPTGGAVKVNVYISKGINAGSPNYTFTAYPGSVTTQSITETTAAPVIIEIQGGLALVTRSGSSGDHDILFPASRYRYKGDDTFGATAYTIFSGSTTGVQSANNVAFWHHDEPIILSAIGDGSGGDTQTGMPLQCLGDTYIIPHTLPGYALSAIYPDTEIIISAYDVTSGWYTANTHSLSGSLTAVDSVNIGDINAGGSTTPTNQDPMIFSANKPFILKVNDPNSTEYDPVGYRQQHRFMQAGAQA